MKRLDPSVDRPSVQRRYGVLIAALALLIGLGTPLQTQADGPRVMTLEDIAQTRSVSEVAVSPDGDSVAYVLSVPRRLFEEEDGSEWRELHVVGETGESTPYITGEVRIGSLAWGPKGRSIFFLTKRDGDEVTALWHIPVSGGEARRVLKLDTDISSYDLSDDGQWIAALARQDKDKEHEELKEQGFNQKVYEEEVRPTELWVAPTKGDEEARKVSLEGSVRGVAWGPEGKRLAVRVAPTALVDDGYMRTRVRVLDAETGEIQARIDNPGKLGDVDWSPDGKHLAMIAGVDINDPREGRLMVVPSTGGAMKDLLPGLEGQVSAFQWKDAGHVVALVQEGVEAWIGEIPAKGGQPTVILDKGGPIWHAFDRANDGTLALEVSTPEHPTEVYLASAGDAKGMAAKRLTTSNAWLDDITLGQQEVVRYPARDGLEIEGLLIRPVDEEEGTRYPLVLVVHGGPESHYENSWLTGYSRPGQVLAGKGFAVFYPNYRASTGRGVAFSKMNHKDPAGKEFDDLVDGVDHLIDMGLVDKDRVGITGGSYGGYATAWGSTYYSERFAAGVMSVGIADKLMSLGTSEIPTELYLVHMLEWPWDNWDKYRERSPIYHVEKARTPLLILHGEQDTRVDPGNSFMLYRFLKILGNVPVRLILYPDEGHGNRKAASRYDFSARLVRWMEHYLKGEGGDPPPKDLEYPKPKDDKED